MRGQTSPTRYSLLATRFDFDPDRGIHGAFCPWPPLYDLAMGWAAKITGLAGILWIPPVAFALFVAAIAFGWSRRVLLAGATAGAAIALSPYLIGISRLAAIDHHWTEPILALAIVAAVIRRSAPALVVAMTVALFVQTALIVACGIALLAILFADGTRTALRAGLIAFGASAAVVSLYTLTRPPAYPSASPWFLGWTHAALLGAAALTCAIAMIPVDASRSLLLRFAALAAGGVALVPLLPAVRSGAAFFGGDPWLRSIVEFQPMFRDPSRFGTDLANLGGGVVALLIAVIVGSGQSVRTIALSPPQRGEGGATDEHSEEGAPGEGTGRIAITIGLFAAAYLLLAITSRRFLVPGIALFAIAGGIAAASRIRWIAWAAVVLTLAPPTAYDLYAAAHREPAKTDTVIPLAARIAPLPPGRVLAPWHAGHAIDVFGRHAVVIDNFGSMPDAALFEEANAALMERDPKSLLAWCRARGVRYLALLDPLPHLPAAAACRGIDPDPWRGTPLARQTVWYRLWRGEQISGFRRVTEGVFEIP